MSDQHPHALRPIIRNASPDGAPQHCTEADYAAYVASLPWQPESRKRLLRHRQAFLDRWPSLESWLEAPMTERLERSSGGGRGHRLYIYYLALTDRVRLDYAWMFAAGQIAAGRTAASLNLDLGIPALCAAAMRLGFDQEGALQSVRWSVTRIALRSGVRTPEELEAQHIDDALAAVQEFTARPDVGLFYGSAERFKRGPAVIWAHNLNTLKMILFHRGQYPAPPKKIMPRSIRPVAQSGMWAVVERWLGRKRLTLQPKTTYALGYSMRRFLGHLALVAPEIDNFDRVTREHALSFLQALASEPTATTGRPMSSYARRNRGVAVAQFFQDTSNWGWDGVPGRPLLDRRDIPPMPVRVPRFIPADELARLMDAVRGLECPYQRAAILTARWSGARRREVQRLPVRCLDSYPDGTARLRIPVSKNLRERVVPLHEEAAEALRTVVALRAGAEERPLIDERTGSPEHFLFSKYGRLMSAQYLFGPVLDKACKSAGLTDRRGRGTVTAHRFRHTVGTQLAESGARLHTIMSVLGHLSPDMAMVYARISDAEVLRDYKAVLGPGAVIAGPGAEAIRGGTLGKDAVDWLKTNFLKTELELGHCLRLPAEGPCECEIFFACSRFVTTPAYASRLRERHKVELVLAEDARARSLPREVERHHCSAARVERLLTDMGLGLTEEPQCKDSERPASGLDGSMPGPGRS